MSYQTNAQELLSKVNSFVDQTCADIELDEDVNRAACKARWLAKFLEVNYCGIYRLDRIEEALVGKMQPLPANTATTQAGYLFVVSEVYSHGGHTPLLTNLCTACEEAKAICVTRARQRQSTLEILRTPADQVIFTEGPTEVERIQHLAQLIASYDKVLLVIHPDDINCAAAARLAKTANAALRIGFINHSDHTFSVGVGIADIVFEISSFGWALREKRGALMKSCFIGLPIAQKCKSKVPKESMAVTGGSWYKYKPSHGQSIFPYLRQFLKNFPDYTLCVVGPNFWINPWWWSLKLAYPLRLHIQPLLPKEQYIKLLERAKIYIDSFPVTGGMAFTESVGLGCLPVGMQVPVMGYSALDAQRVRNPEELSNYVSQKTRTPETLEEWIEQLQREVAAVHQPQNCFNRIDKAIALNIFDRPGADYFFTKKPGFFNTTWLKAGQVHMPIILDLDMEMQIQLINKFSNVVKSTFVDRQWRIVRGHISRWYWEKFIDIQ